jgi:hypothetical protein
MKALEDMDEDERLKLLEQVHRDRVGDAFCYCATEWLMEDSRGRKHKTGLWRLSFVEMNEYGHFPITEDMFLGTEGEMKSKAAELNLKRLDLTPRMAAKIIASSMVG